MHESERGTQLVNRVKRDYARKITEKSELTARDIRDLQNTLGEQYDTAILDYVRQRQEALEHPLPRAQQQAPLGIEARLPQTKASSDLSGRKVSETGTEAARSGLRKKLYEEMKGKSPEQIMQQMNTVDGIKKLRRVLETTSEGKELFKQLSRSKIAELIDSRMKDAVTEQMKLGKFSTLLMTKKSREIVQELLTPQAFERLQALQKNSGLLAQSAAKFFNASQSGTTLTDVGLVGAAMSGIMLGNPFMAVPAMMKIGGSWVMAQLLADPVFLKELQKAIATTNPKKFEQFMQKMSGPVYKAQQEYIEMNKKED
jgi:predicted house-cleaning noncanonical NTP pyrophosphatase (MazG superfamily)